jgi:hypothetical protein
MSYDALEVCTVPDVTGTGRIRGARARCHHCGTNEAIHVNTNKNHGDEGRIAERNVALKFERMGWKIGKTPAQNLCPQCFTAVKVSAKRKREIKDMADKVTPLVTNPPTKFPGKLTGAQMKDALMNTAGTNIENARLVREMTRDERRIIFEKINELYVGDQVGYRDSWTDEKVAVDLGVPRAWVEDMRAEYFGPATNETQNFVAELASARAAVDAHIKALQIVVSEGVALEAKLVALINSKR